MKVNIQSELRANPTAKTQEEILQVIKKSDIPMSLTAIAERTNKSFYQVKATVRVLENFDIVKTMSSSGNTTFVFLTKKEGDINGANN